MNPKITAILFAIFVTYSLYTYLGYSETLRGSRYFMLMGLSLALISNLLWLLGVKLLNSSQPIFWFALGFDVVVTVCSVYVPLLMSKVRFNAYTWLGVGLIITGLLVVKNLGIQQEPLP
jgi:drug/metabolite transporter (DMT)-like permease